VRGRAPSAYHDAAFSAVSLWQVAVKAGMNRSDIDVGSLRLRLFDNG
jgi:hypothetical protein